GPSCPHAAHDGLADRLERPDPEDEVLRPREDPRHDLVDGPALRGTPGELPLQRLDCRRVRDEVARQRDAGDRRAVERKAGFETTELRAGGRPPVELRTSRPL